jgi:hypothetical protein
MADIGQNVEARDAPRDGYALHYGRAKSPMARIEPDADWPDMWRVIGADGELSDMANLARIRDAATAIAERGPPARNRRRFHWKINRSNRRAEGGHVRFGKEKASSSPAGEVDALRAVE